MTSIITDRPTAPQEIKFPCLMEHLQTGCVVLFTDKNHGTLLHKGSRFEDLGYYLAEMVSANIEDVWKPFLGTLNLKND